MTVTVKQGPLYHVAAVKVLGPDGSLYWSHSTRESAVRLGHRRTEQRIRRLGTAVTPSPRWTTAASRCPPTAAQDMDVTYTLYRTRFGPGCDRRALLNPTMSRDACAGRVRSDNSSKVEETRRALIETGLFTQCGSHRLPIPNTLGACMMIEATERLHRTIGRRPRLQHHQGFVPRFLGNRNLFGNANICGFPPMSVSKSRPSGANFRRPDFLAIDQEFGDRRDRQ